MAFLKHIILRNFRSFSHFEVDFVPHQNLIIGENALGKTSLLEAISLISTGRSFRTHKIQELIKKGEKSFFVCAYFEKDGVEQTIEMIFDGKNKKIMHNSTSYPNFSSLLGLIQSVVYAPQDIELIMGSPGIRRRFMNLLIAQKNPLYIYHFLRYTKALEHRNALLKRKHLKTIDVWEEEMDKSGSYLVDKRTEMISEISLMTSRVYQNMVEEKEMCHLSYLPSIQKASIASRLLEMRNKDLIFGFTLEGPHRDDVELFLQQALARNYASEGQKRTLIAAIKLSEYTLLENPLFLIDDFGVHLDDKRKSLLLSEIQQRGQIFLTSPTFLSGLDEACVIQLSDLLKVPPSTF